MTSFSVYGYDMRMLDQLYGVDPMWSGLDSDGAQSPQSSDGAETGTHTPSTRCHLLSIPPELRIHIFSYILPRGLFNDTGIKLKIWIRGSTALLRTCRSLHNEAAHQMYGRSHFAVDIAWDSITFDGRYLWDGRFARVRYHNFPQCFGEQYIPLIQTLVVRIRVVDNYLGMIKYNHHNPAGLLHGYRTQVEHLCTVLERLPHLKRLVIWFKDDSQTQGSDEVVLSPISGFWAARTSTSSSSRLPSDVDNGEVKGFPPLTRSLHYPTYHQREYSFDTRST